LIRSLKITSFNEFKGEKTAVVFPPLMLNGLSLHRLPPGFRLQKPPGHFLRQRIRIGFLFEEPVDHVIDFPVGNEFQQNRFENACPDGFVQFNRCLAPDPGTQTR